MINHLKHIHRLLYLPRILESVETTVKVTPIDEPYLYTDAYLYVDAFDTPTPSVSVHVSNVGGGTLYVNRISIPHAYRKWLKREKKPEQLALTATSDPMEIKLSLTLKMLPNLSAVNTAKLHLISNSRKKTFSKLLLDIHPPDAASPAINVPPYINFGNIGVWKVSVLSTQEDVAPQQTYDFSLIGNFRRNSQKRIEIRKKDEFTLEAMCHLQEGKLYYDLDMRTPGVVLPRDKKQWLKLTEFQRTVSVGNINRSAFRISVKSDKEWLITPDEIHVDGYQTIHFPISVQIEKLKLGRNSGELTVADKRIPVWVWYETVGKTIFTLNQNESNTDRTSELSVQEEALPIEVAFSEEEHPSFMIFEDVHFQFPRVRTEQTGYLIGDFNQWTPRTLFLTIPSKRHSNLSNIILSLSVGIYLFRAEIDGEVRLDPRHLHTIVCCRHGVASRIQIEECTEKLTIRNTSTEKLELHLQSETEWLQITRDTILIPPHGQVDVTAVIRPKVLYPGLNLGWVTVKTTGQSQKVHHAPIFAMGVTNGVVLVLRNSEIEFPKFQQEKSPTTPLTVDIIGKGTLNGEIQPATVLRFAKGKLRIQNEIGSEVTEVTPLVQVISNKPSNAYRKQCKAWLVTDCYLANRRLLPFTVRYNMLHLIAAPPVLYFPKVFLFDEPYYGSITVHRSDGKEVKCIAEIPDDLAQSGLLRLNKDKTNSNQTHQFEFVLNPQVVTTGGDFTGSLYLTDEKTGMRLPINFGAHIISSHADIHIGNATQRSYFLDGIPVIITNFGEAELKIFEVRFKNESLYYTPHLISNLVLSAGESVNFHVKSKKPIIRFRKIEDTILIRLNDARFSQGLFEKKITIEPRGFFLKHTLFKKL